MLLTESLLGSSSTAANYIEDVFSTYLYTGTGASQTITNGIDLSTNGGLVWAKKRSGTAANHALYDTVRGATFSLASNLTSAQVTVSNGLTAFNSNGFNIGNDTTINKSGDGYTSWTFRKQAKFFDVVTYTGNATARTISHNLGSAPGCIIVKRTSALDDWYVYHRSLTSAAYSLILNTTGGQTFDTFTWNNTAPTSTSFSVGGVGAATNVSGATYVAYLFAHDAGGFGASGSDNVISCGSYTGTGAAGNFVSLGYEPQWLLIKRSDAAQDWFLFDNMRGLVTGTGGDLYLNPNLSDAEGASGTYVAANATGFTLEGVTTGFNASGGTYIYIAIRRGPMKTPTSGTSVFHIRDAGPGGGDTITTNFPVDAQIVPARKDAVHSTYVMSRLQGVDTSNSGNSFPYLLTNTTDLEATSSTVTNRWSNTGYTVPISTLNLNAVFYSFRRTPGFFDVVCYTGTGSARTVSHNLGVAPELMITKKRSGPENWLVYNQTIGNTKFLQLQATDNAQTNATYWNNTSPTSSVFSLGTGSTNDNTATYVAYLFATVTGVSKVFSYTGNGSSQTINCGFTGGARFVLIKRTDSTGDWYVWDSARGIVAANDPHLSLNSTAAEVTTDDSVDTDSSGFIVNQLAATNINVNAATYIGLAIA